MRLRVFPMAAVATVASGAATTATTSLITIGTDRSGQGGFSSHAQVQALAAVKYYLYNTSSPKVVTYEARATDFEDQNYSAIAGIAATYAIVFYAQSSITGANGQYCVEFAVEFKGPK
jgi:hypothetical protein